jgi:hypothetical protein
MLSGSDRPILVASVVLVASVGYNGPPIGAEVEVGYSVVPPVRASQRAGVSP